MLASGAAHSVISCHASSSFAVATNAACGPSGGQQPSKLRSRQVTVYSRVLTRTQKKRQKAHSKPNMRKAILLTM